MTPRRRDRHDRDAGAEDEHGAGGGQRQPALPGRLGHTSALSSRPDPFPLRSPISSQRCWLSAEPTGSRHGTVPLNVISQLDTSKGRNSPTKQARSVNDSSYTDAYAQEKVAGLSRSPPVGGVGRTRLRYVAISNQMNTFWLQTASMDGEHGRRALALLYRASPAGRRHGPERAAVPSRPPPTGRTKRTDLTGPRSASAPHPAHSGNPDPGVIAVIDGGISKPQLILASEYALSAAKARANDGEPRPRAAGLVTIRQYLPVTVRAVITTVRPHVRPCGGCPPQARLSRGHLGPRGGPFTCGVMT